jgi:hypothetical protein
MSWAAKILFTFLALASSPAFAERFNNPTLGISIDKPSDWQVLTAKENAENLRRAELGSPEFQAAIERYAATPLFAFTKFAEPHADVNPSIKINTRPYEAFYGKSGQEILTVIAAGLQDAMADFKIITAPETMTLAGHSAGHLVINYSLKSAGLSLPARSELWIIPQAEYFIIIGVGYRQDEKTGRRQELMEILESITLAG